MNTKMLLIVLIGAATLGSGVAYAEYIKTQSTPIPLTIFTDEQAFLNALEAYETTNFEVPEIGGSVPINYIDGITFTSLFPASGHDSTIRHVRVCCPSGEPGTPKQFHSDWQGISFDGDQDGPQIEIKFDENANAAGFYYINLEVDSLLRVNYKDGSSDTVKMTGLPHPENDEQRYVGFIAPKIIQSIFWEPGHFQNGGLVPLDIDDVTRGIKILFSPDFKDVDEDGEFDLKDTCPNTPLGQPVDGNGCSQSQFCRSINMSTAQGAALCKMSDWKNDDPLHMTKTDCKIVRINKTTRCEANN